jgi:hypothetical protein
MPKTASMQDNCFYRGFVKGITGSQVAMDICDGAIHGSIHLPGADIIAITPLQDHLKEERKHVHFLSTEEEPGNEIAARCVRESMCESRGLNVLITSRTQGTEERAHRVSPWCR